MNKYSALKKQLNLIKISTRVLYIHTYYIQFMSTKQNKLRTKEIIPIITPYLDQDQQSKLLSMLKTEGQIHLSQLQDVIASLCNERTCQQVINSIKFFIKDEISQQSKRQDERQSSPVIVLQEELKQAQQEQNQNQTSPKSATEELIVEHSKQEQQQQEAENTLKQIAVSRFQSNEIEKSSPSELKSDELPLITSAEVQTIEEICIQMKLFVEQIINQSTEISKLTLQTMIKEQLEQIIKDSICSSTHISPLLPYEPKKKPALYDESIDQINHETNIFFTPRSEKDSLDYNRWEILLIIITQNEVKEITVCTKQKNNKILPRTSQRFQRHHIQLFNLDLFINNINETEIKFKEKTFLKSDPYRFKIKNVMKMYRGKSVAIYQLIDEEEEEDERERIPLICNYSLLLSITHLIKTDIVAKQTTIEVMFRWLKLLLDHYSSNLEPNQERLLLSNKSQFLQEESSEWYIYFFYGLFGEQTYKILDKYNIFKNMNFKNIYTIRKWEKSPKWELMQCLYIEYLLYNKLIYFPNQFQLIESILKTNLSLQSDQVIKRLVLKVSLWNPRALARCRQILDKKLLESPQFSVYDLFLYKTRYLYLCFDNIQANNSNMNAYYRAKQAESQNYLIITFIAELIQKCEQHPPREDQNQEIGFDKQGIKNIFLRNTSWGNTELRISQAKFCDMYMQLKKLLKVNVRLGDIIFRSLLIKLQNHYSNLLEKHSAQLIIWMLFNPVLAEEQEALNNFFEEHNFTNTQVNQLIENYLEFSKQVSEVRFLDKLAKIMQKRENFKFEFYSIFKKANEINSIERNPQIDIFKKIFLTLLAPLTIPISQNYILKYIRNSFSLSDNELRLHYAKKICSEIKRQVRYDQHFYNIINKAINYSQHQKREFFISIYFENQNSVIEEVQEKLWQSLVKNIQYLPSIRARFKLTFELSSKKIMARIQENKITTEDLNALNYNLNQMTHYLHGDLLKIIEKAYIRKQYFHEKLKLIQYILGKCENLSELTSYFIKKQTEMRTKNLQQVYAPEIGEDQTWFFEFCQELRTLMSYEFSTIKNSLTIDELKLRFDKEKKELLAIYQKYIASKLTYQELQKYFPINLVTEACNILCKDRKIAEKIIKCASKMHLKNIVRLEKEVHSYLNLVKCLRVNNDTSSFQLFLQIIENIKNDADKVLVNESIELIQLIQKEISDVYGIRTDSKDPLSLLLQLQNNEISHIVKSTYESMPLFDMIESRKIDQRSVGDLKEYINDQENSALRIDSIKEFENVLEYWTSLRKSKSVKEFITSLQKKVEKSQGDIWQHIDNCYSIYRLIDQKLDEAANRQTSFKYEIQAIFQNSTLAIQRSKEGVEIKVTTTPLLTGASFINRQLKIEYRRLETFRDKSILLISDIEREHNQDSSIQQTLEIFKRFEQYFAIVENIHHLVELLINYGYNPQFVISIMKVSKNNFDELVLKQSQLQKMCNEWVKGIKQLYKESYILTHFIGSQLSIFINRCLNNEYHPSLFSILRLTQEEFKQKINEEEFKANINLAVKSEPLQQIVLIVKSYLAFEDKIRNNIAIKEENKIILESVAQKYYYCCLFESNNRVAESNRVFYCLQSTKTEEIQVFLWRALIDSSRNYYFIGVHNLKQETKLFFWNQLLYLLEFHKGNFEKAKFIFIDNFITDKFYSFIIKSKLFNVVKNEAFEADLQAKTKIMIDLLPSTWIVESAKAGLGKTYRIEKLAQLEGKNVRYFPISGNTEFSKLANRLKQLHIKESECLSISLFEVQDWRKIQVFLSELILFRCFYYEQFIFLPQDLWIFIEIENIYQDKTEEMYPLLGLLTKYNQGIFIKQFEIYLICFDSIDIEDKFVLLYLNLLDQPGGISSKQLYFVECQLYDTPDNSQELIEKYFYKWFSNKQYKPTFTCYKCFMKMLFKSFKAFSECEYLKIEHVNVADVQFQFLEFNKFREAFLKICIQNVLQFLEESYTSNDFSSNTSFETFHERMNNINLLILPSTRMGNYQFVYTSDENVPLCIKSILLTQNSSYFKKIASLRKKEEIHQLFAPTSLNNLDEYSLQERLQHILLSIADEVMDANLPEELKAYYYPNFEDYKLTLDNFIKICLLWHRASSGIPCIIMGQSGVGKTKLISFFVQQVLKNALIVINLHAGIHQQELRIQVDKIKKCSDVWGENHKVWVFFDEFNTCDELGYIKEMVVDHRFMGEPLPKNIIIVAACNPYRKRRMGKLIKAGIKRPIQNEVELAFTVKAPPLSMIQLMWDYQQLKSKEMRIYIEKILQKISYKKKGQLIDTIVYTHQFLKNNIEISSASLRDVARFKKVYEWFDKFMPKSGSKLKKNENPNYKIDRSERCIILTYSFCYCLRLATNEQREHLYAKMEENMNFPWGWMKKVVLHEQIDYVTRLTISDEQIALNTALIENVFTCLVCLLNKIPILLIGNPGSSKSLSMRLIQSNMRGKGSQSAFCSQFPQLNVLYFQGSQSSTSRGVEQIFEKAMRWKSQANQKWDIQQCILFDQIGLAEKSVHNPLKVLHSKLQTSSDQICFIGISNWELDLAKMSRFLVLARSTPDIKDLAETAYQIAQSFLGTSQESQYIDYQISRREWQRLGEHYFKFINEWQKNPRNKKNFFGLRDFYGYVKFICSEVIKEKGQIGTFERAIDKSIQINFDGQPGSVQLYKQIVRSSSEERISPLELIQFNLQRSESRCLLLIIKGDSLVPLINKGINLGSNDRKMICIHGSTFHIDQESEEYNQEMTALTISHISRGNVLAFKDINNSIQTSLYDLFNKSFTKVGTKRYCRIAVGANSNPKCLVHFNFNAIVYIEEARLDSLDPPFLNRFEKHYLNIKNMITREEQALVEETKKWIEEVLYFRGKESILKSEQFLLNSSEEAVITLVIKHKRSINPLKEIQKDLLANRTTDFIIAIENSEYFKENENLYCNQRDNFSKDLDYIVFTYDEFLNLAQNSIFEEGCIIHIQQIDSEKELRKEMKKALSSECKNIQIYLSYQNHRQHLSFILFLIDQLKTSLDAKKQFFVIIQMHRFSLHHLKIDEINLSYLHPFQQIFLETLSITRKNQLSFILSTKNYFEAYKILKMHDEFSTHFTETIKCCKFVNLRQKNDRLSRVYFQECLQLRQEKYFVEVCLSSIELALKNKQIDLKILQHNNEDIISCSNILQAIEKHIEEKVKEIIYEHLKFIVEKGLLFHFNRHTIQYLKHNLSQQFVNEYNQFQDFIYTLTKQEFGASLEFINSKTHTQFKKGVEENILIVCEETYLLPMAVTECEFIFSEGEQSILALSKKISLQLSSKEEILDTVKHQKELLTTKSKVCRIYQNEKHHCKQKLQKYLIFDILTNFLSSRNRKKYHIQCLTAYLLSFFKQHQIEQKIVLIAFDPTLTLCLIDLLQSISLNHAVASLILAPVRFSMNEGEIELGVINLIQNIIESMFRSLSPSASLIDRFLSIKHFSQYFSSLYSNIKAFYVSFNSYGQQYIENAELLHQFIIFLGRIDEEMAKSVIEQYEQNKKNETMTMAENIFIILQNFVNQIKQYSAKQQILNFLSSHIFTTWIKEKKKSLIRQQYSSAITNYLNLVNAYPSIANKSTSVLAIIFELNDQFQTLLKCMDSIKNRRIDEVEDKIDFSCNSSVSLGFYFSKIMRDALAAEFANNMNNEGLSSLTVREYYEQFKLSIDKFVDPDTSKIEKVAILEFTKIYCIHYVTELAEDRDSEHLLEDIDAILCKSDELVVHLRLFMVKHLLAKYNELEKVRRYFLQMKRCNWIFYLRELLLEERTEIILPIIPQDQDYEQLILTFQRSNFTNIECFHEIIRQGLQSCEKTYLMLNYFLTTFYMRNSPEQYVKLLITEVEGRGDLNQPHNALLKGIMMMYLQHRICKNIEFDLKNADNPLQLILLNYFNVVVSCRKVSSPLTNMLFNEEGEVPKNYDAWLKERFLLESMENPSAERIRYLVKKYKSDGDAASGYFILCAEKSCSYATPIGGFFYSGEDSVGCGALDPGTYFKCNLCGKTSKILENNSYEGKIVDSKTILDEQASIQTSEGFIYCRDENTYELRLKGYQLGCSMSKIKQILNLKQHFFRVITDYMEQEAQFSRFQILQSIVYFVWLIFTETSQIKEDQFTNIFSNSSQYVSQFFIQSSHELLKSANGSLNFKDKQEVMVWHFTLAKKLFQKLSKAHQNSSLLLYKNKQQFEREIDDLIQELSGSNKEKAILQNRRSLIINKTQILKQFGNVELHQEQYALIKMFKLLRNDSSTSKLENLQRFKFDTLSKEYPLLSYLLNFKEKLKLKHFYHILHFVSKLSALNLKITRSDSNQSIIKIVEQYFSYSESQKQQTLKMMKECIRSWNELAKLKYRLKDGCNVIGYLQKIDERMPIRYLIADKNNIQNIEGKRLVQFVVTIANQYNQICEMMENLAAGSSHHFMSEFKMNPSTFNGQNFLQLPLDIFQQSLTVYSHYSVEYGLKELEYEFEKIQNLIIKKLNGCKYFITNKDEFEYIKFIGEDNSFMIFMREDSQVPFGSQLQQKLEEYFKKQQKHRGQTFYKFIKEMIGSLENLIVCFKNKRNYNAATIGQFINEFKVVLKVKNFTKELSEDPLQSLSIYHLGSLYEMLESITFNYNLDLLNPIYNEPLQESQMKALEPIMQKMKKETTLKGLPSLYTLKCVVQRFISRVLLLASVVDKNLVSSYICEIYWLWPKTQEIENYSKQLREIFGAIETNKIHSILKLIDKIQKENEEIREPELQIPVQEHIQKDIIKPLKKLARGNKKKKGRDDLD